MNLTQEPEVVNFPATHYVFVEKIGPFQNTAGQAWQSAHTFVPELSKKNQITGYMSLYKTGPKIYRAGFALSAPPVDLPQGLDLREVRWRQLCPVCAHRTVYGLARGLGPGVEQRGREEDSAARRLRD